MDRVLFVSKPIVPPFHDGTKCLVRDVATNLSRFRPIVLTTPSAPLASSTVESEPVYANSGGFAPAVMDNARVFRRLLLGTRPDLWHFVFAPNPVSSMAGSIARSVRRVRCVQTVASAPRSFDRVAKLLFADRVIALSEWTRARLVERGVPANRVTVLPPPVQTPSFDQAGVDAQRAALGLVSGTPIVTYPGDIERSAGAPLVAASVPEMLSRCPDAHIVFACRKKSSRADDAERHLQSRLAGYRDRVHFIGEVPTLAPLLAISTVVLFPVDDLYGKVDLPIALLEAMALGVPVVTLDTGPLGELGAARKVGGDVRAIVREVTHLLGDSSRRAELAEQGRAEVARRHDPRRVAEGYETVYDELLSR